MTKRELLEWKRDSCLLKGNMEGAREFERQIKADSDAGTRAAFVTLFFWLAVGAVILFQVLPTLAPGVTP